MVVNHSLNPKEDEFLCSTLMVGMVCMWPFLCHFQIKGNGNLPNYWVYAPFGLLLLFFHRRHLCVQETDWIAPKIQNYPRKQTNSEYKPPSSTLDHSPLSPSPFHLQTQKPHWNCSIHLQNHHSSTQNCHHRPQNESPPHPNAKSLLSLHIVWISTIQSESWKTRTLQKYTPFSFLFSPLFSPFPISNTYSFDSPLNMSRTLWIGDVQENWTEDYLCALMRNASTLPSISIF